MKKAFIIITSVIFFLNILQVSILYFKMNQNCDSLREQNRKEFQQCWRSKRYATRSVRRMWDGY